MIVYDLPRFVLFLGLADDYWSLTSLNILLLSIWMPCYWLSGALVRLRVPVRSILRIGPRLLDVEAQPFLALGAMLVVLITIATLLALPLALVL